MDQGNNFIKQDEMRDAVANASNILVVCHNSGNDSLATGISLSKFIQKEYGKTPTLVYSGNFANIDVELLGLYDVKEDIEGRQLKVILDYEGSNIETVKYYKDESTNQFVMEISPIQRDFDPAEKIRYETVGGDYDLIITIGLSRLEDLGRIYTNHKDIFESANIIINIDNARENQSFGHLNILDIKAESLSSLLFAKFSEWQYIPDKEVSRSLLVGIMKA